mgnify:CR=1 FL=1
MMEKTGVCSGEGEAPKPDEKKAADQPADQKCGHVHQGCGHDTLSKMAEKAAETPKQ